MQYPCIPDITSPIVAINYISTAWMGLSGSKQLAEFTSLATKRNLVVCTIRRLPCMKLSDARKLVVDYEEGADEEVS
jgi:hypothetical protein